MSRRLDALQLFGVLASAALLWFAATPTVFDAPSIRIRVGAPVAADAGTVAWPVRLRLSSTTDVYLTTSATDAGRPVPTAVVLCDRPAEHAATGCSGASGHALPTIRDGRDGRIALARDLDGGIAAFAVTAVAAGPERPAVRLAVNATPCAPPVAEQVWRIRHTAPTASDAPACRAEPASWLPIGIVTWAATLALRVVDHRSRLRRR